MFISCLATCSVQAGWMLCPLSSLRTQADGASISGSLLSLSQVTEKYRWHTSFEKFLPRSDTHHSHSPVIDQSKSLGWLCLTQGAMKSHLIICQEGGKAE